MEVCPQKLKLNDDKKTDTPEKYMDEIISAGEKIPSLAFNTCYDNEGIFDTQAYSEVYDNAFRVVSLKKICTLNEDGNTLQDICFSGSVLIPKGVSGFFLHIR